MIEDVLVALGLVAVIEGLVLSLAPRRLEDFLEAFSRIPVETRRGLGLLAVAIGVFLVWVGRSLLG